MWLTGFCLLYVGRSLSMLRYLLGRRLGLTLAGPAAIAPPPSLDAIEKSLVSPSDKVSQPRWARRMTWGGIGKTGRGDEKNHESRSSKPGSVDLPYWAPTATQLVFWFCVQGAADAGTAPPSPPPTPTPESLPATAVGPHHCALRLRIGIRAVSLGLGWIA
jgi:hypothetical protein